jgi:hypothetical protein
MFSLRLNLVVDSSKESTESAHHSFGKGIRLLLNLIQPRIFVSDTSPINKRDRIALDKQILIRYAMESSNKYRGIPYDLVCILVEFW